MTVCHHTIYVSWRQASIWYWPTFFSYYVLFVDPKYTVQCCYQMALLRTGSLELNNEPIPPGFPHLKLDLHMLSPSFKSTDLMQKECSACQAVLLLVLFLFKELLKEFLCLKMDLYTMAVCLFYKFCLCFTLSPALPLLSGRNTMLPWYHKVLIPQLSSQNPMSPNLSPSLSLHLLW